MARVLWESANIQLAVFNSFVLDPQHLQPLPSTLAAVDDRLVPLPIAQQPSLLPNMSIPNLNSQQPNAFGNTVPGNMAFNPQAMQQTMMMMMQMQQMMTAAGAPGQASYGGTGATGLAERMGGGGGALSGGIGALGALAPLPPAPAGGEDPRARRGRMSYRDLDEPGGAADGGLPY